MTVGTRLFTEGGIVRPPLVNYFWGRVECLYLDMDCGLLVIV